MRYDTSRHKYRVEWADIYAGNLLHVLTRADYLDTEEIHTLIQWMESEKREIEVSPLSFSEKETPYIVEVLTAVQNLLAYHRGNQIEEEN